MYSHEGYEAKWSSFNYFQKSSYFINVIVNSKIKQVLSCFLRIIKKESLVS